MKVKNQTKVVMYVGEVMSSVTERKDTVLGLGTVIKAAETKEISLPTEQLAGIKSLRDCLLALKPSDQDGDKTKDSKKSK